MLKLFFIYFKNLIQKKTNYSNNVIDFHEEGYKLPLILFKLEIDHDNYLLYQRQRPQLLDVIANIGALFPTFKYFFRYFFLFIPKILIIIKS